MPNEQQFIEFCKRKDPKPYKRGKNGKYECPCCKSFTLTAGAQYDICEVCFWEDDGTTGEHGFSPNSCELVQAKKNYNTYGACDENAKQHVRPPKRDEREF